MLFNSLHFLIYFPIVVFFYFSLAERYRNWVLLVASYYFYMSWRPEYVFLLLISTFIDYYAGIRMSRCALQAERRKWLVLSVCANLFMLFSFKYFNFFNAELCELFAYFALPYDIPALNVLLPVGISFYTFQSLSYGIDVYRGVTPVEKRFSVFALYVSFFPQLVAGPIERSTNLLPQFNEQRRFDVRRLTSGLKLMWWGFFKKVVIADQAALFVDQVYGAPGLYPGLPAIIATYVFAFQIYCDFSGYCDIAIGAARVLGFRLTDNFARPYTSESIAEFWRRWHITLSTWFRDYLYLPLGGNRVSTERWYFNIMTVFLLSGLWHGANWTFVIWGALHGISIVLSSMTKSWREAVVTKIGLTKYPSFLSLFRIFITFHIVWVSWIFFRAASIHEACFIISHLFTNFNLEKILFELPTYPLCVALGSIVFLLVGEYLGARKNWERRIAALPVPLRFCVYYAALALLLLFGNFGSKQFIYFQF